MEYKLLTPGPLTTSKSVKESMLQDSCTWGNEYKEIVQNIRKNILNISNIDEKKYTTVLMQGSGSFGVESVLISTLNNESKILVLKNGAYGNRIDEALILADKKFTSITFPELYAIDPRKVHEKLKEDNAITHVIFVHLESSTGIVNPLNEIIEVIKSHNKVAIVDAMSSYGGIPIDYNSMEIDFLISSANKCIQGIPGFSFIIANREELKKCKGNSISLSLDLYDQWEVMEKSNGSWRFTSPTHSVIASNQALNELIEEGGVEARFKRYKNNRDLLVKEMAKLGFETCAPSEIQSPIVTAFAYPSEEFNFEEFYSYIKERGFVIFPGKLSTLKIFRVANIGEIYSEDIIRFVAIVKEYIG
ncbi:MAG: 2-aminoethylphosphonate--pyruvate transaminase [Lachnospirales bacterium]